MYTGTLIEDLIATVERVEHWNRAESPQILRQEEIDMPVAYLLESLYDEQLMEVG